MPVAETYRRQVSLLIRLLPLIARESCFALKGGTAINLFVRDLPRLSVDIDLAYLPIADRASSLAEIDSAMRRIAGRISDSVEDARIVLNAVDPENTVNKLLVRSRDAQVKVEVTPVLRGCVYDPSTRSVSPGVENQFGFAEMNVVSFADLYAGKLVAALDRQHPRDLFDVRSLLANEGIGDELRIAFAVYLISHNRPMAEILKPNQRDIEGEFKTGFQGMTDEAVTLDDLLQIREALIAEIVGNMPPEHRRFLVAFELGEADWGTFPASDAAQLPAVVWRAMNLAKLAPQKRRELAAALEDSFAAA